MNDLDKPPSRPFCGRCRLSSQCIPANLDALVREYVICSYCGGIFQVQRVKGIVAGFGGKRVATLYDVCGAFIAESMSFGNLVRCVDNSCLYIKVLNRLRMPDSVSYVGTNGESYYASQGEK